MNNSLPSCNHLKVFVFALALTSDQHHDHNYYILMQPFKGA